MRDIILGVPLGDDSEDGEGGPSQLGSGPGSTNYVNHEGKDEAVPHENISLALMSDICKKKANRDRVLIGFES